MKGRITSALFIAIGLIFGFLCGEYYVLNIILICCLSMAIFELYIAEQFLVWDTQVGWPTSARNAWLGEIFVLAGAVLGTMLLDYKTLTAIILCAFASDVCAFAVGKTLGKHKVGWLKGISPNKSYEGYIGGIVLTWPIAYAVFALLEQPMGVSEITYIALAGVLAEVGDLLGSASKRALGIKDSNEFLKRQSIFKLLEYPLAGHGGYLDRFDSVALSLCAYFILYLTFG